MEKGIHYYLYYSFKLCTTQEGFFDEIDQKKWETNPPLCIVKFVVAALIVVPPEIKDSFLSNL